MIVAFLSTLCILLTIVLAFVVYHAIRWARIIFVLEDDLTEAVEVHERTVAVFENLLQAQVFFDSPEIKAKYDEALQDVRVCQTATQKLIQNFTQRSKQRYVRLVNENEEDE